MKRLRICVIVVTLFLTLSACDSVDSELLKQAKNGDVSAQFRLGTMYVLGQEVAHNEIQAKQWLLKAAEQGHLYAQFNLGIMNMYSNNFDEAAQWFTKAAKQDESRAQLILGMLYFNGEGVPQNYTKAIQLFQSVMKQENATTQLALDYISDNLEKNLHESGEQNEISNIFDKNGRVVAMIQYIDDISEVSVKTYFSSGKLKSEGKFKNGKPNGVFKEYYYTGELSSLVTYSNGLKNGIEESYSRDGKVIASGNYTTGKPNGKFSEVLNNKEIVIEYQQGFKISYLEYILGDYNNFVEPSGRGYGSFRRMEYKNKLLFLQISYTDGIASSGKCHNYNIHHKAKNPEEYGHQNLYPDAIFVNHSIRPLTKAELANHDNGISISY